MEIFNSTLTQMLVMFCFILIGFVLKKMQLLPDNGATVLSKLENYVLVPALVLDTFMTYCKIDSLRENYNMILYCMLLLVVALVISLPLSKVFSREKTLTVSEQKYRRNIYKYALTFGNFAFMGNAVVLGVLGDEGLFNYLLFTLPLNIAVYTWGVIILIPEGNGGGNALKNLFNPIFVSLIAGLIMGLLGIKAMLPDFVITTISNAKGCMGPVAMILTGFVIGGYNIRELLGKKRIYAAAGLRLIVIPALMLLLLKVLGVNDIIMTLAVFAYATPLGLNTVVFPAAYGGDTKTGAAMAMISHTLAVVTIPLMYLVFIVLL
ncbi:MAG: AEC family transporter [Clostridia bacterium]|nr:AEC family transporter [Clostridia bacterium]